MAITGELLNKPRMFGQLTSAWKTPRGVKRVKRKFHLRSEQSDMRRSMQPIPVSPKVFFIICISDAFAAPKWIILGKFVFTLFKCRNDKYLIWLKHLVRHGSSADHQERVLNVLYKLGTIAQCTIETWEYLRCTSLAVGSSWYCNANLFKLPPSSASTTTYAFLYPYKRTRL